MSNLFSRNRPKPQIPSRNASDYLANNDSEIRPSPINESSDPASNMIRLKLAQLFPETNPTPAPSAPTQAQSLYIEPTVNPLASPQVTNTFPTFSQYQPQTPKASDISAKVDSEPSLADIKQQLLHSIRTDAKLPKRKKWGPVAVAITSSLLYLVVSYNEVAVAQIKQFISPGSSLTTPLIIDPNSGENIGKEPRLIIPKINVDTPVVYDVVSYDEQLIQSGLERGVVHYGTTALPGQIGSNVIVGHSSNNFLNGGAYKFVFVLLDRLEVGDTFILHYEGIRYVYEVYNKSVIEPTDFSQINKPVTTPEVILITCTPPGTSWRRLIIQARQISPDPSEAKEIDSKPIKNTDNPIPGNAPSFWDRLF